MANFNKPAKGFNLGSYHDLLLKNMALVTLRQFPFFFLVLLLVLVISLALRFGP